MTAIRLIRHIITTKIFGHCLKDSTLIYITVISFHQKKGDIGMHNAKNVGTRRLSTNPFSVITCKHRA